MGLLQELLADRGQVIFMIRSRIFCSCGQSFVDLMEAENHLVQHERISATAVKLIPDATIGVLAKLVATLTQRINEVLLNPSRPLHTTSLELPDRVCAVTLEENQLAGGRLGATKCPECAEPLLDFSSVKQHYTSSHPDLWSPQVDQNWRHKWRIQREVVSKRQFLPDWTYRFYCPIPSCKYHLVAGRGCRYFASRSHLQQHYNKVHAARKWTCPRCSCSFPTHTYLKRHELRSCGRQFVCQTCSKAFKSPENVQTHCRRKKHVLPPDLIRRTTVPSTGICLLAQPDAKVFMLQQPIIAKPQVAPVYVNIAPKPSSSMHLRAAIALSELSGDPADAGQEPQCISLPDASATKVFSSIEVQTYLSSNGSVAEQETQTPLFGTLSIEPCFTSSSNIMCGTQTSPPVMREKSEAITQRDIMLSFGARHRPPKLGDIEQFSTETQTDTHFDLRLLKQASSPSSSSSEVGDDLFTNIVRNQIEAQTQFDLEDILCSNYTQTNAIDDDVSDLPSFFISSKTQTVVSGACEIETTHMETQTNVDDFFTTSFC